MARGSGSASGNGMQSSAAVKRILKEVAELAAESERPGALFTAAPLESDLFEMHFTVRGPPETAFEGGLYHGRILLPPEYPLKVRDGGGPMSLSRCWNVWTSCSVCLLFNRMCSLSSIYTGAELTLTLFYFFCSLPRLLLLGAPSLLMMEPFGCITGA